MNSSPGPCFLPPTPLAATCHLRITLHPLNGHKAIRIATTKPRSSIPYMAQSPPSTTIATSIETAIPFKPDNIPTNPDVIIIGSGFGGLSAAAALTAYGRKPLVLESHYSPGGTAHGFVTRTSAGTFHFDTGPSFFCALSTTASLNPLKQALDLVGESVPCASYDRFVIDDLAMKASFQICDDDANTLSSVRQILGEAAANQLSNFYAEMRRIHAAMRVPSVALRGDWRLFPMLANERWAPSLLKLLPYSRSVSKPIANLMRDCGVTHPVLRRLLDVEAFLLSGLKTDATIAAEIAFMIGERGKQGAMEYPIGGASAIVNAFIRGIQRKGGAVRTRAHVEEIIVRDGKAVGVRLRSGDIIYADYIFSNASIWDTVRSLLPADALPAPYRRKAVETPMVESFMHAHIAIPSDGLPPTLIGHHAVVLDSTSDIAKPGNTVMVSIPTLWSPTLAPPGWHIIHTYTLEPYDNWQSLHNKDKVEYTAAKQRAAQPLFAALRHIIPDIDERISRPGAVVKLGSPLTHARFNRRYRGTYGAAIRAGEKEFEWPDDIPIAGLKRCGDSTFPGIGVPSSAAAGLIAANELVSIGEHRTLVEKVFPREFDNLY